MYKFMKRLVIYLFIWVIFFSIIDKLKADTAHINYVSSTSDQYTQLKSELEDLGYTVQVQIVVV